MCKQRLYRGNCYPPLWCLFPLFSGRERSGEVCACLTLRTGRPLFGGLSFHGVSGLRTNSLAHGLPGGIQAQDMRGGRCRPGSLALGGRTNCFHTPWVAISVGEQRGPDCKHSAILREGLNRRATAKTSPGFRTQHSTHNAQHTTKHTTHNRNTDTTTQQQHTQQHHHHHHHHTWLLLAPAQHQLQ